MELDTIANFSSLFPEENLKVEINKIETSTKKEEQQRVWKYIRDSEIYGREQKLLAALAYATMTGETPEKVFMLGVEFKKESIYNKSTLKAGITRGAFKDKKDFILTLPPSALVQLSYLIVNHDVKNIDKITIQNIIRLYYEKTCDSPEMATTSRGYKRTLPTSSSSEASPSPPIAIAPTSVDIEGPCWERECRKLHNSIKVICEKTNLAIQDKSLCSELQALNNSILELIEEGRKGETNVLDNHQMMWQAWLDELNRATNKDFSKIKGIAYSLLIKVNEKARELKGWMER